MGSTLVPSRPLPCRYQGRVFHEINSHRFIDSRPKPLIGGGTVRCRNGHNSGHTRHAQTDTAADWRGCVIMECDGVLVDVHTDGHRVAFNRAFEELGYTCAQWTPSVYFDLLRLGDSTGPGLVKTYYELIGWPMMLPTSDRTAFTEKVYATKQRIFKRMVDTSEIPLREGVTEFIDDVIEDNVHLVVLAGTASAMDDSVVSAAMMNLGINRSVKMQVLTVNSSPQSAASEEVSTQPGVDRGQEGEENDNDTSDINDTNENQELTFEQRIAIAQNKAKSSTAVSFARAINLQNRGVGMRVDPTLLAKQDRALMVSPEYLAAIVAALGCSSCDSALIAASHSIMEAAKAAGMYTAGVPPSLTARGGYSAMDVGFDGFGAGGGLTWRKLKSKMMKKADEKDP